MPRNINKYQYETSPRKLEPNYATPRKNDSIKKKSTAKKVEKPKKKNDKKEQELKLKQKKVIKHLILGFSIIFAICYRNAKIDEQFGQKQDLKAYLQEVEKQNAQLEIAIENALNLNNVEQQAKELLGMQKLNNKQTVYVDLEKNDYIEAVAEDVVIEEESILQKVIKTITSLFK